MHSLIGEVYLTISLKGQQPQHWECLEETEVVSYSFRVYTPLMGIVIRDWSMSLLVRVGTLKIRHVYKRLM